MKKYLYQDLYIQKESHWWHIAKREEVKKLFLKYVKKKSVHILDVGCGTGENMRMLSAFGKTYGIDFSKEAIAFCKKRGLKLVLKESIEDTTFANETFDAVTALDVIEHVADTKAVIQIHRILKKNGVFILSVPAFQLLWSQWDVQLHHKRRYSLQEVIQLLSQNGFSIRYGYYAFSFLFVPVLLIRFIKSTFKKTRYGSDFSMNTPVLNTILLYAFYIEEKIRNILPIPFGTTIFCVAKKI